MDGQAFDRLTRGLGARIGRRGLLASALALATVGGDAGAAGSRTTCRAMKASCTRNSQCCSQYCETSRAKPRNQRNRCACTVGLDYCDGACVDLSSSVDHCGGCGNTCAGACISGVCAGCHVDVDNGYNHCAVDPDGVVYQLCNGGYGQGSGCSENSECASYSADCDQPGVICLCVKDFGATWFGPEEEIILDFSTCQALDEKSGDTCPT